ncbi:MAG: PFL family protein [Euryarchaeota archaeon]|nr:PFL family protein [Euryarchaeota archaeon]MBU4340461.1 PFL family protein [Euryarchaeota archaeon]MBU4453924.1 PFL family protein [Euryarchaeota archaeon]MCG2737198.1 PFL family protein [Candidatus Methanoperedenaceae archaeon]
MEYSLDEVMETVRMTLYHNFDIRTATLGINLKDCIDTDIENFKSNVYDKVTEYGKKLVYEAGKIEDKYGVPIINKRISVTPVSLIVESCREDAPLEIAKTLDRAARDVNIDFIGGYGALVQKGMTRADSRLIDSLPEMLSSTERVCAFLNVASTVSGMNMDAIIKLGNILKDIASKTENGIGCTKFAVFSNAPEDNPFMAGAFHGVGEPDFSLNIGISGPGVVRSVVEKNRDCDLTGLSEVIKRTAFKITRAGELVGRELASNMDVPFGIVDISLASTNKVGDSVAGIVEMMGIEKMGAPGSTAALALLIDAVKKGGAMASGNVGGLSGTFIPVSEDSCMNEAVKCRALSIEKLEALTAVCSVGLDMIAIPGDTPAETISGIIADELSIGVVNGKTTGVRLIPVPGKIAGDYVNFGGLLGETYVMDVSTFSSRDFILRGGRMPAPITSMRN